MKKVDESITWSEYKNIAGIVISALAIAGSIFKISIDVAVLTTKVEANILQNQVILSDVKVQLNAIEGRLGKDELVIAGMSAKLR